MDSPEQIAIKIVDQFAWTTNVMSRGTLVSQEVAVAALIAEAIEEERDRHSDEVGNLRAGISRLHFALQRYGLHTWDCASNESKGEHPCDCGWQQQLDESHGMTPESPHDDLPPAEICIVGADSKTSA